MNEGNSSKLNYAADEVKDVNSKKVFHNPVLCSQFLREYSDIPVLKNVQPEDIEDMTELYQAYLGIEFEADSVKKIHLRGMEDEEASMFLISLIEHKSDVDYNVAMQILKYMVCIWNDYARQMEQKQEGISKNKNFRYPPILPIIYYEGVKRWTADMNLRDRIWKSELFENYLPDFTYHVVRVHDYSNEELLNHGDEMSLIMMINKIQNAEDFAQFCKSSPAQMDAILKQSPGSTRDIIKDVMFGLLMKMNVPVKEATGYVKLVEECRMGYLFENMEKMDIQAERRNTAEARKRAEEAEANLVKVKKEAEQKVEEAEQKVEEAEQKVEEAEQKVEEAEQKAEEAEQKAEEAEQKVEEAEQKVEEAEANLIKAKEEARIEMIQSFISTCREFGCSDEEIVERLIKKNYLSREEAEKMVVSFQ